MSQSQEAIVTRIGWKEAWELPGGNAGKSSLSACAAMLCPGLGHWIAGEYALAVIWFVVLTAVTSAAVVGYFERAHLELFFMFAPAAVVLFLVQYSHASHCGKYSTKPMMGDVTTRKATAAMVGIMAVVLQCGAFFYLQKHNLQLARTPTPSMEPAVARGDLFLLFKGASFQRWDVLAVNVPPGESFTGLDGLCKRVVGLPGETIEITSDGILIDGKIVAPPDGVGPFLPLDNSYQLISDAEPLSAGNGCWGRPITLGPDEYFMLGDNTMNSDDSRFWHAFPGHQAGAMPRSEIEGRVVGIVWPPARAQIFR